MRLEEQCEIIGILHAVKKENNQYKLKFTFTEEIELSATAFSQKKLNFFIGKKIGIFCCYNSYRLRLIKDYKCI
jgi:hypothetical protein